MFGWICLSGVDLSMQSWSAKIDSKSIFAKASWWSENSVSFSLCGNIQSALARLNMEGDWLDATSLANSSDCKPALSVRSRSGKPVQQLSSSISLAVEAGVLFQSCSLSVLEALVCNAPECWACIGPWLVLCIPARKRLTSCWSLAMMQDRA